MVEPQLLQPEERVLSTLEKDGARLWLTPRLSRGRFLKWRRAAAYALIAIFTIAPYLKINGKPVMLLDVVHREFTFFGQTFLPTDTILLALFMVGLLLAIFLVTALLGRVWCGWACPQTVYLEFVYRPIERLFSGTSGAGGKRSKPAPVWKQIARYIVYLVVSMFLAHTFLAYFVGVESLFRWVQSSPVNHPVAFTVMAATTALMMFDFCYFREQLCILACPYGRFQSVLLDRQSLIICYDENRGEPRGKLKRKPGGDVPLDVADDRGDCVDCKMCVTTCPTGIDIRDGLQLECVGCAQCIDACDAVMDRINRPRGLIRYSTQQAMAGQPVGMLRPRVVIYPAIILVVAALFGLALSARSTASVTLLRNLGHPFVEMPDGRINNTVRIKVVNRGDEARDYTIQLDGDPTLELVKERDAVRIDPGASHVEAVQLLAPRSAFIDGTCYAVLHISDGREYDKTIGCRLLGPLGGTNRPPVVHQGDGDE